MVSFLVIDVKSGFVLRSEMRSLRSVWRIRNFALLVTALGAVLAKATHAAESGSHCCVWRVTNVSVPFYLVGTIHALSARDYPLPAPYEQAIRDSRRLLFEIDPSPKSDFSQKFAKASSYPKGDDISHHVHPQTLTYLWKNFRISNYDSKTFRMGDHYIGNIRNMRPWAIVSFIWGIRGYNDVFGSHGVDRHVYYQASRRGAETAGLESDDTHVEVLKGMADMDAEIMLLDALVKGDKRRDEFNELRAAWKRGDVAAVAERTERDRKQNLGASLRLLDYRNLRWIPRIEAEIENWQADLDRGRRRPFLRTQQRDRFTAKARLQNRATVAVVEVRRAPEADWTTARFGSFFADV